MFHINKAHIKINVLKWSNARGSFSGFNFTKHQRTRAVCNECQLFPSWVWSLSSCRLPDWHTCSHEFSDAGGEIQPLLSGTYLQDLSAYSPVVAGAYTARGRRGQCILTGNDIFRELTLSQGAGCLDPTTVMKLCPATLIRMNQLIGSIAERLTR